MRFHQAVTFLPTQHALELAKAADAQGYDGIYVSDHMFFPRDRQSRYTYSTREDGAPGFGTMGPRHRLARRRGASSRPWRPSPSTCSSRPASTWPRPATS